MSSIIPGFEYDIFISYRQKDNKGDHWVTEFVNALKTELESTFKDDISIYFDENSHDGLLATHDVDDSLKNKLKSLIFVPIISQTYCDSKSFAWSNEFLAFKKVAFEDPFGLKIKLAGGNVASRVLPVRIHEIDVADQQMLEGELQGKLRAIDFIYHSAGVNRPLTPKDERDLNLNKSYYRDQINKVANSVKEIILGLQHAQSQVTDPGEEKQQTFPKRIQFKVELNRRNVLRASLAYVLLALVFWEITSIGIDLLDFPANTLKVVTLALIIFFPLAVLLAWLFERSPQGFIRTGSTASLSNPFSHDQKKPLTSNSFILLLLATATALYLFFPHHIKNKENKDARVAGLDASVAVLPFDNLSNDPGQEYFSLGMMDEILNHLYKIGNLRVTSRTSSMAYKGSKKTLVEIAGELSVAHLLEGSVQKDGDKIRIIVQLIDGKTDEHLWSETYDREYKDVFAIQSDIAQQVAENLRIKIDPDVKRRIEMQPTQNTAAYDLLLLSRDAVGEEKKKLSEKAISLDPNFAEAYAALATYWIFRGGHGGDLSADDVLRKALPLVQKALDIDPNLALGHINLAWISLFYKLDFNVVESEYRKILQLYPSSTEAALGFSDYLHATERSREALALTTHVFNTDKNDLFNRVRMALSYYFNNHVQKSIKVIEEVAKLSEHGYVRINYIRLHVYAGKYEEAIKAFEKKKSFYDTTFDEGRTPSGVLGFVATAHYKTGQASKAIMLLDTLIERSKKSPVGSPSYYTAAVYTAMAKKDLALQYLAKAYADHEVEMYWIKVDPAFIALHGEPRFKTLVEKVFKSKKD